MLQTPTNCALDTTLARARGLQIFNDLNCLPFKLFLPSALVVRFDISTYTFDAISSTSSLLEKVGN